MRILLSLLAVITVFSLPLFADSQTASDTYLNLLLRQKYLDPSQPNNFGRLLILDETLGQLASERQPIPPGGVEANILQTKLERRLANYEDYMQKHPMLRADEYLTALGSLNPAGAVGQAVADGVHVLNFLTEKNTNIDEINQVRRYVGDVTANRVVRTLRSCVEDPNCANKDLLQQVFNRNIGFEVGMSFGTKPGNSLPVAHAAANLRLQALTDRYAQAKTARERQQIGSQIEMVRDIAETVGRPVSELSEKDIQKLVDRIYEKTQKSLAEFTASLKKELEKTGVRDSTPEDENKTRARLEGMGKLFGSLDQLAGAFGVKDAHFLLGFGQGAINFTESMDKALGVMKVDKIAGSALAFTSIVSFGVGIAGAAGLLGPDPVAEQLHAIRKDIYELGLAMNERFDRLEGAMLKTYTDVMTGFVDLNVRLDVLFEKTNKLLTALDQQKQQAELLSLRNKEWVKTLADRDLQTFDEKCLGASGRLVESLTPAQVTDCELQYYMCSAKFSLDPLEAGTRQLEATADDFYSANSTPANLTLADLYSQINYLMGSFAKHVPHMQKATALLKDGWMNAGLYRSCAKKYVKMAFRYFPCYQSYLNTNPSDPRTDISRIVAAGRDHVDKLQQLRSGPDSVLHHLFGDYLRRGLELADGYKIHANHVTFESKSPSPFVSLPQLEKKGPQLIASSLASLAHSYKPSQTTMRACKDHQIPSVAVKQPRFPLGDSLVLKVPDDLGDFMRAKPERAAYIAAEMRGLGEIQYCIYSAKWTDPVFFNLPAGHPSMRTGVKGHLALEIKAFFIPKSNLRNSRTPETFLIFDRIIKAKNEAVWGGIHNTNLVIDDGYINEVFTDEKGERFLILINGGLTPDGKSIETFHGNHIKAELDNYWDEMQKRFAKESIELYHASIEMGPQLRIIPTGFVGQHFDVDLERHGSRAMAEAARRDDAVFFVGQYLIPDMRSVRILTAQAVKKKVLGNGDYALAKPDLAALRNRHAASLRFLEAFIKLLLPTESESLPGLVTLMNREYGLAGPEQMADSLSDNTQGLARPLWLFGYLEETQSVLRALCIPASAGNQKRRNYLIRGLEYFDPNFPKAIEACNLGNEGAKQRLAGMLESARLQMGLFKVRLDEVARYISDRDRRKNLVSRFSPYLKDNDWILDPSLFENFLFTLMMRHEDVAQSAKIFFSINAPLKAESPAGDNLLGAESKGEDAYEAKTRNLPISILPPLGDHDHFATIKSPALDFLSQDAIAKFDLPFYLPTISAEEEFMVNAIVLYLRLFDPEKPKAPLVTWIDSSLFGSEALRILGRPTSVPREERPQLCDEVPFKKAAVDLFLKTDF